MNCIVWNGRTLPSGYGYWYEKAHPLANQKSSLVYAHQAAYVNAHGPIPDKHDVHHACDNKSCVNPDHLEALTRLDHMKLDGRPSGANALKTHCVNGHEFSARNTRIDPKTKVRICRRCQADRMANRRKALKP